MPSAVKVVADRSVGFAQVTAYSYLVIVWNQVIKEAVMMAGHGCSTLPTAEDGRVLDGLAGLEAELSAFDGSGY